VSLVACCTALALPAGAHGAAWQAAPENVSPGTSSAFKPAVAIDPGQELFLAWERDGQVEAAIRPPGGSFAVAPITTAGCTDPDIAADSAGNAIVVCVTSSGIRATLRNAGGNFGLIGSLLSGAGATDPRIAFTSDGAAIAVWVSSAGHVEGRIRPPGGPFGGAVQTLYDGSSGSASKVDIATDPAGDAMATFVTPTGGDTVRAVLGTSSGFGSVETVAQTGGSFGMPQSAMDAAGNAAVVVGSTTVSGISPDTITTTRILGAIRPRALGTWTAPADQEVDQAVTTSAGLGPSVGSPTVTYDSGGRAVAAWSAAGNTGQASIRSATAAPAPSQKFGAPLPVATSTQALGAPAGAPLSGGAALFAFSRPPSIDYVVRSPDGSFSPDAPASTSSDTPGPPSLAADPAGDVAAAWERNDPAVSHFRIQSLVYDATPPVLGDTTVAEAGTVFQPVAMSATATDVFSPVTFGWAFGDGTAASGGQVSHAYAAGGPFDVTMTATDAAGNSAGATRRTLIALLPAPAVQSFSVSPARFAIGPGSTPVTLARKRAARGTTFRYRLSAAGTVKIAIARAVPGRRSGKRCVKPTKRLAKKRRCTRFRTAGTLTRTATAGANATKFTGRIGRKPLKPGRYRAAIVETQAGAAGPSEQRTVNFTVVAR
jgi:hypothetical protein